MALRNAGNMSVSRSGKAVQIGIRKDGGWENYVVAISLLEKLLRGETTRIPVSTRV